MDFKERVAIRLAARYIDQLRVCNPSLTEDIANGMFCDLSDCLIAMSDTNILVLLDLEQGVPK